MALAVQTSGDEELVSTIREMLERAGTGSSRRFSVAPNVIVERVFRPFKVKKVYVEKADELTGLISFRRPDSSIGRATDS